MASEATAPASAPPEAASEDEYQTFCAALSASARGRAFLAEYTKRNRGADTEVLLGALARLEAQMRRQAQAGAEPVRAGMRGLLAAIRAARPEVEASALPLRAAKLAQLLDLLERRIEALVEPVLAPPPEPATGLAVVPPSEQPELPIPSPAAAQAPPLSLAHARAPAPPLPPSRQAAPDSGTATVIPEVTWLGGVQPAPTIPPVANAQPSETRRSMPPAPKAQAETAKVDTAPIEKPHDDVWALSTAKIAPPPPDPLAALMLLSEEERLALFT